MVMHGIPFNAYRLWTIPPHYRGDALPLPSALLSLSCYPMIDSATRALAIVTTGGGASRIAFVIWP